MLQENKIQIQINPIKLLDYYQEVCKHRTIVLIIIRGKRKGMVYPSHVKTSSRVKKNEYLYIFHRDGKSIEKKNLNKKVSGYMKEWLLIKKSSIRLKTAQDYRRLIRKYIHLTFKDISLSELTTFQLNHFYQDLLIDGVGSRTVRYIHSILRVAFKDAIGQGLITTNPTDNAMLPRWQKKEMQILDEEQISKFLQTAKQSPYYGIYHFAIATGMRKGELLGLKWMDVDWTKATLFIRRQAQRVKGHGIVFEEPKTRAGIRKVKIQHNSIQELHNQKKRVDILKEKAGDKWA